MVGRAWVTWDRPFPVGYALTRRSWKGTQLWGRCADVEGLFVAPGDATGSPFRLIGCEPATALVDALRRADDRAPVRVELCPLDASGREMQRFSVTLDTAGAQPSATGGALLDIPIADGDDKRLPVTARPVWDLWRKGVPTSLNQWTAFSAEGRNAWLRLALHLHFTRADTPLPRSGGEYHLDGRAVSDVPGLHCALGEALDGPGGYYGSGMDAMRDCLSGGFAAEPPFRLVWHDARASRRALADVRLAPEGRLGYFDDVFRTLRRFGVIVELC
ncbi:barstar family protein [Nocardiopsis sp. FIRDI 009]|uniref:barstar family protein n=1 Tax=Nocardiopsis sp. FIRDI 009 TaxID=714197 RepID=UPI000E275FED|nr:barstar family protein [Nocardiopsis sp. FIRDI 009]